VVAEVRAYLHERMEAAVAAGVDPGRLCIDPGIGFAKTPEQSLLLLREIESFLGLGRPVLVGPSRKSFLQEAAVGRPAVERDWATAAAVTASVLAGAHIVRVHAVAEMVQVVRVAEEIRRQGST